ncbi:MAG: 16S rRNA (uracil(1498)-N(3))-methyltransferase [Lachnospiraceae bacterium]
MTGSDYNHIKNVLRMKIGEEIALSNGVDQKEYRVGIVAYTEDTVECELRFIKEDGMELPAKIYLFQGLPKGDKMELIIQKAVELGVHEIIPVSMNRCVVRLDEKKASSKQKRWQIIAEASAKQSKRGIIPEIHKVLSFEQALSYANDMQVKMLPYELANGMEETKKVIASIRPGDKIAVWIGPEGGFDKQEVSKASACGFYPISLGKRILRTETAGMTVLSILMYHMETDQAFI